MQQLTSAQLMIEIAEYSPDSRYIAMMARRPDQPWRIYWVSADGGTLHEVPSQVVNLGDPTWSPNGQFILYGQPPYYRAESSRERNLYLYDLRSGKTSKLPNTTGLFSPRWSPDGRYVAALTIDEHALVILDLETGQQRRLDREQLIGNPFWSTDSQWAYFNASTSAQGWRAPSSVWRLNAHNGQLEQVTMKVDPRRCSFLTANGMRPDGSLLFICSRLYRDIYELEWK
jgi:Tol biopolymer transport system component